MFQQMCPSVCTFPFGWRRIFTHHKHVPMQSSKIPTGNVGKENKDRAPRLHSIQNTRTGPQCHEPRFSRELDPKADSIHLLTKLYLQNEGDQNEGKQEWTGAGGNGDSHGESCPLRSRFEPQVCCNRGKSDYWQVREQMTRVNIMEVLLAYVQVQTEELWRGFLWENPERGNLQCKRGGMAYQERRSRQEDKQVKQQDDGFPSRSRSQRYNKGASGGERDTTGDASKTG